MLVCETPSLLLSGEARGPWSREASQVKRVAQVEQRGWQEGAGRLWGGVMGDEASVGAISEVCPRVRWPCTASSTLVVPDGRAVL